MSITPLPAHQALPQQPASQAELAASGRRPVPAHRVVAKNGIPVQAAKESGDGTTAKSPFTAPGEKSFSFWDILDIVNPLQHIPVVSTIYRQVTGDEISNFSRVVGGGLFGGFIGAAIGGVNAAMVDNTGKDVGETVVAALTGNSKTDDARTPSVDDKAKAISIVTADATPAAAGKTVSPAVSHALFDHPGGHVPYKSAKPAEDSVSPAPLIEVRPHALKQDVKQMRSALPIPADVANLADLEPGTATPLQKEKVQQAMLDALLKMQESQNSSDLSKAADAKI